MIDWVRVGRCGRWGWVGARPQLTLFISIDVPTTTHAAPKTYKQVENAYYAAKGAKATDPEGALQGFQQVEWGVWVYGEEGGAKANDETFFVVFFFLF